MASNKLGFVFLNGNFEDCKYLVELINKEDILIGCDGGADVIYQLNMKPLAVVGDMDSVQNIPDKIKQLEAKLNPKSVVYDDVTYLKYPKNKDYLDSELAIDYAFKAGASTVIAVNSNGNEIDHVIGSVFMVTRTKYQQKKLMMINSRQVIKYERGHIELQGKIGEKISLIPINSPVVAKGCEGLKYDLSNYTMDMDINSGISNELTRNHAEVQLKSGGLLIVQHHVPSRLDFILS